MIDIDRWPAIIFTNYRSGSTEFGYQLANKYQVDYFPEPSGRKNLNGYDVDLLDSFLKSYNSGKFILKFMPDQLKGMPEYQALYNSDCFKIKLTRKSEFNQIVSFYIAVKTGNWGQTNQIDQYSVDIDKTIIKHSIDIIVSNNNILKYSSVKFDQELEYENLDFEASKHNYKTTPPSNIDDIRIAVQEQYKNRLDYHKEN
jgi:hypothetical protein